MAVSTIAANLRKVHERIARAAEKAERPASEITLVAVSKTHEVDAIRAAVVAGQTLFGENYAQELLTKVGALGADAPIFHFIGHLQSNKVRDVVRAAQCIETLGSARLAAAVADRCAQEGLVRSVFVQVNVGGEAQKSGCAPNEVAAIVRLLEGTSVEVRGLMTVPPASPNAEDSRTHFRALRTLASEHGLSELSMGMSADLEVAIEEGATLVRVGTAIFGART